jgi:hypothetical protein
MALLDPNNNVNVNVATFAPKFPVMQFSPDFSQAVLTPPGAPSEPKPIETSTTLVPPNPPRVRKRAEITSRFRGVCWYKRTKKWVVQTKIAGKRVHVGYFDDEEQAHTAYLDTVAKLRAENDLAKQQSETFQL